VVPLSVVAGEIQPDDDGPVPAEVLARLVDWGAAAVR
jgi:hypothetical protein